MRPSGLAFRTLLKVILFCCMAIPTRAAHSGFSGGHSLLHHMHRRNFLGRFGLLFASPLLRAQRSNSVDPVPDESISEAAKGFLAALRPELRRLSQLGFDDPKRKDWSNLPHYIHPRKGLRLGDLTPQERAAAHRLLQAILSSQGYYKATAIMAVDDFLGAASDQSRQQYGSEYYFLDVFGEPGGDEPWGVQIDGHHLAVNVTVVGHRVTMTPAHFGADPAVLPSGRHAGWQVLGGETAKGFALRNALTPEQTRRAVLSETLPPDIFTLPGRDNELKTPAGVNGLAGQQRDLLESLVDEYVGNLRIEVGRAYRTAIQSAGFDKLHFAWMGPAEIGKAVYYRVHGPTLLIEYDAIVPPNTKLPNDPNHIHTVLRVPGNDFGEDWLRRHHQEHHQK